MALLIGKYNGRNLLFGYRNVLDVTSFSVFPDIIRPVVEPRVGTPLIVLVDKMGVQPIARVEVSVAIDTMLNFDGKFDETVMLRLNISPLFPPPPPSSLSLCQ